MLGCMVQQSKHRPMRRTVPKHGQIKTGDPAPTPSSLMTGWHGVVNWSINISRRSSGLTGGLNRQFLSRIYNRAQEWSKGVVLQHKHESFPRGTALYDIERGKLNNIREDYWQTDASVSYKSWCYVEDDEFKSTTTVVHDLVDIVSKNGNLLLNIGPKADGTIPEEAQQILLGLGAWLNINGEAIYGASHWHTFGEGPTTVGEGHMREREDKPFGAEDVRFTVKDGMLYAICLGWHDAAITIKSLGSDSTIHADMIKNIHMLGSDEPLLWSQDAHGLTINTPSQKPCDHAYTFKLTL
jgi:alpha-L-fucosidase